MFTESIHNEQTTNKISSILITGGTGSLGSALCRHLVNRTDRLIVFSRRWQEQVTLRLALGNPTNMRWFIGDVRDYARLITAMNGVDYVIHAAAIKSVPDAEYNPLEAVYTNIMGTANVLMAAQAASVKRVMVISTDKACAPLNFYGKTKSVAEGLTVAHNNYSGKDGARYSVCRYGNVIGSSGSVIPIFKKQKETGAITVTNPEMTRFWITMDQAVRFVLRSMDAMRGGEIFIPKLKAASIANIADAVAPDAEVEIIHERGGEKLHEALLSFEEVRSGQVYDIGWAYYIAPIFPFWSPEWHKWGEPVGKTFRYTSDKVKQLGVDEIKELLG